MPAIFFASNRPPTRPRFICSTLAAPVARSRANSYFVVSLSPAAMGIEVARATFAISSGISGGVGSSSQIVSLQTLGEPYRAGRRELAMRSEQQVRPRADRLARQPHKTFGKLQRFEIR